MPPDVLGTVTCCPPGTTTVWVPGTTIVVDAGAADWPHDEHDEHPLDS
jgi:hypothetical protein